MFGIQACFMCWRTCGRSWLKMRAVLHRVNAQALNPLTLLELPLLFDRQFVRMLSFECWHIFGPATLSGGVVMGFRC